MLPVGWLKIIIDFMARRPKIHDKKYFRRRLYGGWMPENHSNVWLENGAYNELLNELEYLRRHPQNVDPSAILALLDRMMSTWKDERNEFKRIMQDMINHYKEALDVIELEEEEINRLQDIIDDLQTQLDHMVQVQNDLQRQIDEINEQREKDRRSAIEYRNEAVAAYNEIANDVYYHKYAPNELMAIQHLIQQMDKMELADAAIQGLSVECLTKIYVMKRQVERMKSEFAMLHTIVMRQARELQEQYECWRDNLFFDPEKEKHVDVNFWSMGLFAEAFQNVKDLVHNLELAPEALGYMIENLRDDMKTIAVFRKEGETIVEEVLNKGRQSEMVEAMGRLSALIMAEDFLFRLVFQGYNEDDERDAYVVQLANDALGAKMQLVFSPYSAIDIACNYRLCFSQYFDESIVRQMANAIFRQFENNGIRINGGGAAVGLQNVVDDLQFNQQGTTCHLPKESRVTE